jgi:phosphomannomutase / phosphoglucomutase
MEGLPLPRYVSSPEIRISCPEHRKNDIVRKAVRESFASRYRVIDIDGARIYFGERDWALIRASNTSAKLSLRFEGRSEEAVERDEGRDGRRVGQISARRAGAVIGI